MNTETHFAADAETGEIVGEERLVIASDSNELLCVGDFEIRKEGNLIFIKHSSGESGVFDPVLFEKCVDSFFNENF